MSWEEGSENKVEQQKTEVTQKPEQIQSNTEAAKVDVQTTEPGKKEETQKAEEQEKKEPEKQTEAVKSNESEELVSQKLIGKVAKAIREKAKAQMTDANDKIRELQEENRRLKEAGGNIQHEEPSEQEKIIENKIAQKFVERYDEYGKQKYGKQNYLDACQLIINTKDPAIARKIYASLNPADAVMEEASKIARDMELGDTPAERETKKQEQLKAKWRAEWEKEMAEKLDTRKKQPTDVRNVRSAGGDVQPNFSGDTWANTLPK